MAEAAAGPLPPLTLVSGPARSGKSRWAEHLVQASRQSVVYLATGPLLPGDADWQRRLERHRRRRPAAWGCWEVGGELATALPRLEGGSVGLIDSLGTWIAAHLELEGDAWEHEREALIAAIGRCPAPLVVVCEETGWGVVPPTAAGGRFRDRLGRLQSLLTARCDRAWLVLQGRVIDLLAISRPVPPET